MKDCLVLSSSKNKSSFFNGLQSKKTGSNPVALTTFPNLDSGSKLITYQTNFFLINFPMEGNIKFIVLAKYTKLGADGWLDNPDEGRKTMVSGLSQKIACTFFNY